MAILLSFFAVAVYGQKDDCYRNVPYFRSLKPVNLAHRLTKGLETDSAKVCAIHSWITHKIKYNVKKAYRGDFGPEPPRRVLWRRKTVCSGYSNLFTALCLSAGIPAATISGYARNYLVDVNDRFFLEDHAWNAVYIDGKWLLADATWDAGYIKFYKITFGASIKRLFFPHKPLKYKLKPRFIRRPNNTYFLKEGAWFLTDHVPADPIWQLLNTPLPILQVENDSSYYYALRIDQDTTALGSNRHIERLDAASNMDYDRTLSDGFAFYKYNHKNQYHLGLAYLGLAKNLFADTKSTITDSATLVNRCDSVSSLLESALLSVDSNTFFLTVQKLELDSNNVLKYSIIKEQNGRLIRSTVMASRNLGRGFSICIKSKQKAEKLIERNEVRYKTLRKDHRFDKAKTVSYTHSADSASLLEYIEAMSKSIDSLSLSMNEKFVMSETLYWRTIRQLRLYDKKSAENMSETGIITFMRMHMEDDLDYFLRLEKDSLLQHKFIDDSLLCDSSGVSLFSSLGSTVNLIKAEMEFVSKLYKSRSSAIVKLKKSCVPLHWIDSLYDANIDAFDNETHQCNQKLANLEGRFEFLKEEIKAVQKQNAKEMSSYKYELVIEKSNFSYRKKEISNRISALKKLNNMVKTRAKSTKIQVASLKKKYQKK